MVWLEYELSSRGYRTDSGNAYLTNPMERSSRGSRLSESLCEVPLKQWGGWARMTLLQYASESGRRENS
jgi:hypothetical protein